MRLVLHRHSYVDDTFLSQVKFRKNTKSPSLKSSERRFLGNFYFGGFYLPSVGDLHFRVLSHFLFFGGGDGERGGLPEEIKSSKVLKK